MVDKVQDILNLALIGSAGSGKTTFCEALLVESGAINSKGTVEAGTTTTDYQPREKQTQHSIDPAFVSFNYQSKLVNVIDTPGFHDYIGRTLSVLPAVETAVLVVDAQAGVDTSARRLFKAAREYGLCGAIVVNKIDGDGVNLTSLIEQIQLDIGKECLPINLPSKNGTSVVDCFLDQGDSDTDIFDVEVAHEKLVDQIVEIDEDLMELYLEGEDLPEERLVAAFLTALRESHLVPVFFSSAVLQTGISEFLQTSCRLLPDPSSGNAQKFTVRTQEGDAEQTASNDQSATFLAQVIKVTIDPYKGRMAVVRVYDGTVNAGVPLYIDGDRKPAKMAHAYRLMGAETIEVESVKAGEICAFPRMESVQYNSILRDARIEDNIRADEIALPTPVLGKAIQVENDNDAQKVSDAFQTIAIEDPSFRVVHVAALNEMVIRGMGEAHLRGIVEHVEAQYGVKILTDFPSIEYKETITVVADGHNRHKKQTGGAGQFGEVYLKIEPMERGAGFEFVDEVVGGVIPGQFIPAVEKGVRQVMVKGAISGHEMQDIRVRVYDGKHHPVDSKEIAFVQAGKKAFLDAITKARPIVMEPVVSVTVNVPSDCMGDVTGDLASMGGIVSGSSVLSDTTTDISGKVPLREMQTYHSRLSSISGGKGTYTMEFSHYAAVQSQLQKELASGFVAIEEE